MGIKATKDFIMLEGYTTTVYPREQINQLPKTKDNAFLKFIEMITESWTYEKLTEEEQKHLLDTFEQENIIGNIKGDFNQRWNIMQAMYSCFLSALNYADDPIKWRQKETRSAPQAATEHPIVYVHMQQGLAEYAASNVENLTVSIVDDDDAENTAIFEAGRMPDNDKEES